MIKMNRTVLASILGFAAVSANAATAPASVFAFDSVNKNSTFSVTAKGWSDPAFGDAGWTHNSGWGSVDVKKGQTVTITAVADNKGVHPGATVWYRDPVKDTAPDNYVIDHFYQQNASVFKNKAVDESTSTEIGNIVMKYIAHGYDLDKNSVNDLLLKGKKDGTAGKLTLSFKAPSDGIYMFVVGGFNPDANYVAATGADGKALKESVKVSVSVK